MTVGGKGVVNRWRPGHSKRTGPTRTPFNDLHIDHNADDDENDLEHDQRMRVSVPTIPHAILSAAEAYTPKTTPAEAVVRIAEFLAPGNVTVITGAGVSVDSGIRAYRGSKGRYLNPNYK